MLINKRDSVCWWRANARCGLAMIAAIACLLAWLAAAAWAGRCVQAPAMALAAAAMLAGNYKRKAW